MKSVLYVIALITGTIAGCTQEKKSNISGHLESESGITAYPGGEDDKSLSQPLVTHIYTADPAAHLFNNRVYIYPSHDINSDNVREESGGIFDMKDYHVLSMDNIGGEVIDHGVALDINDVPWAKRQMWAPDAAEKNGIYYLYFPAKDENDIFRIGVASSKNPQGPFNPEPNPIEGSFSIDPMVFKDSDSSYYLLFGGIWGGQLQRWKSGSYIDEDAYPMDSEAALMPKIARLSDDMLSFDEPLKDIQILDDEGNPLTTGDNDRRFFEAVWLHQYNGKYYLSYSTGDTHKIVYATGDNVYGPFMYQGIVLNPVEGWTNHQSIIEIDGKWYLFYHDSKLSKGEIHLRAVKVTELKYKEDGSIIPINAYLD